MRAPAEGFKSYCESTKETNFKGYFEIAKEGHNGNSEGEQGEVGAKKEEENIASSFFEKGEKAKDEEGKVKR